MIGKKKSNSRATTKKEGKKRQREAIIVGRVEKEDVSYDGKFGLNSICFGWCL